MIGIFEATILAAGTIVAAVWLRPVFRYRTLHEAITNHIQFRRDNNAKIQAYCKDIMRSLDRTAKTSNINRPASVKDCTNALRLVEETLDRSVGCSEAVATYCAFYERTLSPLRKDSADDAPEKILVFSRLLSYLIRGAATIENAASNYMELPDKFKTLHFNPIRQNLRSFVKDPGLKVVPGLSRGLDLSPLSVYALDFYAEVLHPTFYTDPEFYRSFLKTLGKNSLVGVLLYQEKIYFPLTLDLPASELFGKQEVMLIGFSSHTHMDADGTDFRVTLYYSHLNPVFHFMKSYESEFKNYVVDSFLCKNFDFRNHIQSVAYKGNEIIAVNIKREVGQDAFLQCKTQLEDWLIQQSGRWWPKERLRLWFRQRVRNQGWAAKTLGITDP